MTTATNPPDMLQSVHLQGFKGFRDTKIGPLRQVNLVLGGQNVGKTSLLEAVYMASSFDANFVFKFRQVEGEDVKRYCDNVFGKGFIQIEVYFSDGNGFRVLNGKNSEWLSQSYTLGTDKSVSRVLLGSSARMNRPVPLPVSVHVPDQLFQVGLFGQAVVKRQKKPLIDLLRKIEPHLESLDAVSPDGEQRVYAELTPVPVALPLQQLGHGFNRLFVLFAQLLVTDAKLVLVDEVENGIHYSALPTVFKGIRDVALDRGVQSIMTTHSWDAIRAACEVFADTPELFQVIRLERTEDDNVKAVCIEGERMLRMMDREMEVR